MKCLKISFRESGFAQPQKIVSHKPGVIGHCPKERKQNLGQSKVPQQSAQPLKPYQTKPNRLGDHLFSLFLTHLQQWPAHLGPTMSSSFLSLVCFTYLF